MAAVADYAPAQFNALPAFDDAQQNLKRLKPRLERFGAVISSHNGDGRVGLALLHRHFDMNPGERLIERVNVRGRVAVGRPARTHGALMPHLFRARLAANGYTWYPVEFVDITGCPEVREVYAWFVQQNGMLDGVARTLETDGALDTFGLCLSHGREEIECAEDEVLVEEADALTRTLMLRPRKLAEITGATTPTNWDVRDGSVRMRCTCQRDSSGSHGHFETN